MTGLLVAGVKDQVVTEPETGAVICQEFRFTGWLGLLRAHYEVTEE